MFEIMTYLHDVFRIARYEVKIQSREWIFRVLILFMLLGIASYQVVLQGEWFDVSWDMIALPSSMPWFNAYLFNIAQTVLAIFVVAQSWQRSCLKGAMESLYVRPFDNSIYLWGKITGIIILFILLNICSIGIGILLNLFGSFASFNFWYYLFYFFFLTLPSLFFILGLGVWLSGMIRFRYITLLIMWCIMILSMEWGADVLNGTFDFSGNSLFGLFSSVAGLMDISFFLFQRVAYFLFGLGFMFLSVYQVKRIPNQKRKLLMLVYTGMCFLVLGIACIGLLIMRYVQDVNARTSYRASFACYWNPQTASVTSHDIAVKQENKHLGCTSRMTLLNTNEERLTRLVLFLNPGLEIQCVKIAGKRFPFKRDNQVLWVDYNLGIKDSVILQINYSGEIDSRFCDLNLTGKQSFQIKRDDHVFRLGRRTVFVDDNFILLTPASGWYPTTKPPVYPEKSFFTQRDFTYYRLSVVKPRQAMIFSQGEEKREGDTIQFVSRDKLTGISLCGGDYEVKRITVRGVEVELGYLKKYDFFSRFFSRMTAESLVSEMENPVNGILNYNYIDKSIGEIIQSYVATSRECCPKLLFLECPLFFDGIYRFERNISERIQPGMVLFSERGVGMDMHLDMSGNFKKRMIKNGYTERMTEVMILKSWLYVNFLSPHLIVSENNMIMNLFFQKESFDTQKKVVNPHFLIPMLCEAKILLYSEKYPIVDMMMQFLFREKSELCRVPRFFQYSRQEWIAYSQLQGKNIKEILERSDLADDVWNKIFKLISEDLLNRLTTNVSFEQFFQFLENFYATHSGIIPLETFAKAMKDTLNVDLIRVLSDWENCKHLSRFAIQNVVVGNIKDSSMDIFKMQVQNDGDEDGYIAMQMDDGEADFAKSYIVNVGAGQAKEIQIVDVFASLKISSLSCNLPGKKLFEVGTKIVDSKISETGCFVTALPQSVFKEEEEEIIVDNEDAGFRLIDVKNVWLQSLLKKEYVEYDRFDYQLSKQVMRWTPGLLDQAYGKYIQGFYYKMGGRGDAKAEWSTVIQIPGKYEVFVMAHNYNAEEYVIVNGVPVRKNPIPLLYNYTISNGNRETVVKISPRGMGKWVSLGIYDFPAGETRVSLSDKGEAYHFIVADAVKWVKIEM